MPHERSMGLRSEIGEFFMRAIFINAVDQKVEEIQIENELHAFYERIGCDMIQCIDVGESHLLVCDEEGRLRNWKVGFRWPGSEGIAGNALLVTISYANAGAEHRKAGGFRSRRFSLENITFFREKIVE